MPIYLTIAEEVAVARFHVEVFLDSLVDRLGLFRSSFGSVYGVIDGQPVHVAAAGDGHKKHLSVVVATLSADLGEVAKRRLVQDFDGLTAGDVVVEPKAVTVHIPFHRAAAVSSKQLRDRIVAITDTVGGVGRVRPAGPGDRPAVVDGRPRYLGDGDEDGLRRDAARLSNEYEARKPQWGRGVAHGLLGVGATALTWAVLALLLDREFWLVAAAGGLLIGYLTLRGTGKADRVVQVLIGVMAVGAVVVGQILTGVLFILREFGVFDPAGSLGVFGEMTRKQPGPLLFGLGGGLVGAWYGARIARKPEFAPHIEIAPI